MNFFKKYIKKIKRYFKFGLEYLKHKGFRKQNISRGEAMIKSWLTYSDCIFKHQYKIKLPEGIRKTNRAYIDFMVWVNDKQYAIEYNGRQHYHYVPYFHKTLDEFCSQLKRDEAVKQWCKENNVIFVEISYKASDDEIIQILKDITE